MKPLRRLTTAHSAHIDRESGPMPAGGCGRFWFRLAVAGLPFLLLGLLELGLRFAGWGYPTSFFLKSHPGGRTVLVENSKFGWRFFPPGVARSPQPLLLAAEKSPGTIRIFIFGESAAMGDPEPAYGFARQLERLLQARHPDRRIEVVNVAMTAINSHVIREIARDCAPRGGDCWVLYAGNNEVIGPYGAGTVFGRQAPGLGSVRANLALRRTRAGQLLARALEQRGPAQWEGMELFLDQQVRRDDPRLGRVYDHFAANLADIIECGKKSGAKVLAATMAVNLLDSPPFSSQHRMGMESAALKEWERVFALGREAENQGRPADALEAYRQAAQLDPDFAELAFRRAVCERASGRTNEPLADFQLARDLDTLRFRADSRLNQIVRQTAAAHNVRLIDAEQDLARRAAGGLPGEDLFYDHVHLNFAGNHALASLFVPAIEAELFGAPAGPAPASQASAPLLTQEEVARRLAFTDFDRRRVLEEVRMRMRQAPFTSQSNFSERDARLGRALAAAPVPLRDLFPEYRAALALTADDAVLHANFGRLLVAANDTSSAAAQWRETAKLLPHEPDAWFQLGNLEQSAGNLPEAARLFQEALQRKPNCTEARNGLGLVLAAQGRAREAIRQFETALAGNPYSSATRINLAVTLATQGKTDEASALYRAVLKADTNNVGARVNLAKLLTARGRTGEAITLYTEAVQLKPDNAIAQYNLANALAAQGRHAEAARHYAAAVQAQPDFVEARYNLARELTQLKQITEALPQFAEAVRLKPDWADAHYNYGIALAKVQHYAEAARELQEALKRQPDNADARAALERVQQLGRTPR